MLALTVDCSANFLVRNLEESFKGIGFKVDPLPFEHSEI